MQRISWERTTPEGWPEALKRMILLDAKLHTADDVELGAINPTDIAWSLEPPDEFTPDHGSIQTFPQPLGASLGSPP